MMIRKNKLYFALKYSDPNILKFFQLKYSFLNSAEEYSLMILTEDFREAIIGNFSNPKLFVTQTKRGYMVEVRYDPIEDTLPVIIKLKLTFDIKVNSLYE